MRLVLWASAVVAAAAMSQPRGWCLLLLQREEETEEEEEVEGVLDLSRGWKAVLMKVDWVKDGRGGICESLTRKGGEEEQRLVGGGRAWNGLGD